MFFCFCCLQPVEATEVQAYNDFIIFSVAGGGSLISGVIYATYGWLFLIYLVSGMVRTVYLLPVMLIRMIPC